MPDQSDPRAALRDLARAADGFDRSWSISADGRVEERFLLFFDAAGHGTAPLAAAASAAGLGPDALAAWQNATHGADALGLGANTALTSLRLYTQYWEEQIARIARGERGEFVLYRGWKLQPGGGLVQDDYRCTPLAPRETYWPKIVAASDTLGLDRGNLEAALDGLDPPACVYTETTREGRDSWLATVRKCDPPRDLVAAWLAGLPASDWADTARAHAARHELLHIAGGDDTAKSGFVSLYFESDLETTLALLA